MMRKYSLFDEMFEYLRDFDDLRRMMLESRSLPGERMAPHRMLPAGLMKREFLPAVECFTRDRHLVLRIELPGVDPKDVEISVVGGQMVLRGEKKDERRVEEKDLLFREITHGKFERSFTLPEGVRTDQIKANFENGVLEVSLPSEKIEPGRKVPIEVGGGKKGVKAA